MAFSTTQYPYSTVVYITDTIGGQSFQGSGVMISPDEVLTAAHVVYTAGQGPASGIVVRPGYNAGSSPFGSANAAWFHYFKVQNAEGTISNEESQYDYAVIHLSSKLSVGTMGTMSNFGGGAVHVTGYTGSAGGTMIDYTETVTKDPTYSLLVGADTGRGSSGGPVWVMQNNQPYVVGLVSSGDGVHSYNVQITTTAFNTIKAWVAQDDYSNPLIDVVYYTSHYADVAAAPVNPAWHYAANGWHEMRDPSAFFSTAGYLAFNKDVAAAGVMPLDHYASSGWREGRDPSAAFDTTLYLQRYSDIARAGIDPLLHYMTNGKAEGRIADAAIGPRNSIVGGIDREYYLLANPDIARSGADPELHFNLFGWKEGRNPNAYFDTKGYLANYADVAAIHANPLQHYDLYGWKEGRDPTTRFDTKQYLAHYGDVAAAHIDPLQHFLQAGIYEGRSGFGDGVFG